MIVRCNRAVDLCEQPGMADNYDLAIIGSGPGGYVAAIRAAQLGLKTVVIERAHPGGICLNWGCIPTKALLRSSEVYHLLQKAEHFGLSAQFVGFELNAMVERSRRVAKTLSGGVSFLMKKNKVPIIEGTGRLTAPGRIRIESGEVTTEIEAKDIILATGARARELPFAKSDGDRIWTYPHALVPGEVPDRLLVIGSGAIGCEFASFFRDLGSQVTIVEMLDRVLPVEDADVSNHVAKSFERQGMELLLGHGVEALVPDPGRALLATIRKPDGTVEDREFTHSIVAIGIVPNTEGIGLEEVGVATERGQVVVDALGRTSVPGVWAIGDIVGAPWLAHKASHEGVVAVEAIAGGSPHAVERTRIPGCTYSRPQVASVGLTETMAREQGRQVRSGRFPLIANGKAIALGEPDGFCKTVFDAETNELIGAHMVGPEVTEMVQGFVIAMNLGATEADLANVVFAHPTVSEAMHESILGAYGRALHI